MKRYTKEQKTEIQKYESKHGTMNTVRKYGIGKCTLHRWKNPGLNAKYCKKQYDKNREERIDYRRKYYKENKETIIQKNVEYARKHPELQKHWASEHKEERRAYMRDYLKEKYKNDPQYRVSKLLRRRIRHALNGTTKSAKTEELIGCTFKQLKEHIESQFTDGMCWDHISEIHIDHIRPCASFDLTDPDQQRECFNYTNLQPLWAYDNLSKGVKYVEKV
jgi:hypothetical protein